MSAATVKSLVRRLTLRGPHRVLRGDLALLGTPGVVFTPAQGFGLPAVAFGHGWLTGARRYRELSEHLASWGFVVIAPDTERGPVPSPSDLAADLAGALDVAVGVRLGNGEISVHPDRLGLVGHGMGAGAAVLAAARHPVTALAALFPAPISPSAVGIAPAVTAAALVVTGARETVTAHTTEARKLAAALGGKVSLREIEGAAGQGLVEGRQVLAALGIGGTDYKTIRTTRALLTGYLLHTLTKDKQYRCFTDDAVELPKVQVLDPTAPISEPEPASNLAVVKQLLGRT